MKHLASPATVAAACGLIVLTNLALLGAAGWNRRGGPTAELSLTERELTLPAARQDEGTGLELSLVLAHQPPDRFRRTSRWKGYELPAFDHGWLDRAKLIELGFSIALDPAHPDAGDYYSHAMARRVYVVAEQDGEAWNRWIAGRDEEVGRLRREVAEGTAEPGKLADAEAVLAADRTMRSRLVPVDAGLDAGELRRRYGDRPGHAILAGLVRPKVVRPENGVPAMGGDVLDLAVSRVDVSDRLMPSLEGLVPAETWEELEAREREVAKSGWPSPAPPRYRAILAIGRRHEPWLTSLERIREE